MSHAKMRKYILKTTGVIIFSNLCVRVKVLACFIKRKTILYSFFEEELTTQLEIKRRAIEIDYSKLQKLTSILRIFHLKFI